MKNKTLYFVSGVSGVGKTAIIPYLKEMLPNSFEVYDFDERGVPDNAGSVWRLAETRHWISLGKQKAEGGITIVVCGFSNPEEIEEIKKDFPNLEVKTILLDGDAALIEKRLRDRNTDEAVKKDLERAVGPADAFIENNTRFVPILRKICQQHQCAIIDTSDLSIKETAERVSKIINPEA